MATSAEKALAKRWLSGFDLAAQRQRQLAVVEGLDARWAVATSLAMMETTWPMVHGARNAAAKDREAAPRATLGHVTEIKTLR
ncbi:MAG: hypothetical protein Q8L14_11065 [Myxococcales bacterium]|nr:hypothetical protein [Myxococcales bacterium]